MYICLLLGTVAYAWQSERGSASSHGQRGPGMEHGDLGRVGVRRIELEEHLRL